MPQKLDLVVDPTESGREGLLAMSAQDLGRLFMDRHLSVLERWLPHERDPPSDRTECRRERVRRKIRVVATKSLSQYPLSRDALAFDPNSALQNLDIAKATSAIPRLDLGPNSRTSLG